MKHIVNMSGGAGSFWAASRVIEMHGRVHTTLLFADVLIEDEDLYRFLREASEFLKCPIVRISAELNPWQAFEQARMIGKSGAPICSIKLKREPLDEWHRANAVEMDSVLYVGLDWTEGHRLEALRKAKPWWRIEAPMCEPPLWDKCKMLEELKRIGIAPPRLYTQGFPHNNCGGFCVKAGHAQFALLLRTNPDLYAWHEAQEEALRAKLGDFSVLTDRRGGRRKTLTMRQFRLRCEAGEDFDRHDWGGCGCAVEA